MRLVVICSHYPPCPSPEGAHAQALCEQLAARGLVVDFVTSKVAPDHPEPNGFMLHPLVTSWGWSGLPSLLRSIRRLRPDAVLLIYIDWIYDCHPMITFAPTVLRWLLPGVPFITQFENVSGLTGGHAPPRLVNRLARRFISLIAGYRDLHQVYGTLLRDSNRVITLSEHHAEVFRNVHASVGTRITVIPAPPILPVAREIQPGSARQRGRSVLGLTATAPVLAYFGNVYWMKGIDTLLTAFATLPPDTHLLIIGGSSDKVYLDVLHSLSRHSGGSERVIWLGYCEDAIASLYLQAADVCVLPFNDGVRLNNSSFSVAASHGLPIVTTRGESLESPFLDGENVRLCPPKDPAALAMAITKLIHSPETRRHLATGALQLAGEHFSWDQVIDKTLNTLNLAASCK